MGKGISGTSMRMSFEQVVDRVREMTAEEMRSPLGVVAEKWGGKDHGITIERILDASDCLKMLRREPTLESIRTMKGYA